MTPRHAKRHFIPTFAIAMLTSATIFATLSYFCVTTFGPITNGSITAFLLQKYGHYDHTTNDANDHGDNLTHIGRRFLQDTPEQQQQQQPYLMDWLLAANAAVSLSVLITYPLQIFPALELAEPILNPKSTTAAQRDAHRLELIPQQDDDDNDDNDHHHDDENDNLSNHASPKQDTASGDDKDKTKKRYNDKSDDDRLPFQMVPHHQQPPSRRGGARGGASNTDKMNGLAAAKGRENDTTTTSSSTTTISMEISATADESNTIAVTSHTDIDKDDEDSDGNNNVASVKTRIILVLLTFVVAVAVPNFQVLISLAGALAGSTVALLIPPALEIAWLFKCQEATTSTQTPSRFTRDLIRCYLLFALGLLFLCIGTGASLLDIYETYRQGSSATTSPKGDDTGP
jgi:Transmembrane amino acid transporter protein